MSNDRFREAMGHIDDRLLARYQSCDEKLSLRKKRRWLTLAASAACLALIITAMLAIPPKVPTYNDALFTAEEIGKMFSAATNDSSGTNAYTKIYVPTAEHLGITAIPETQYLHVYEYREINKQLKEAELRTLADFILSNLAKAQNSPIPQYTVKNDNDELKFRLEQDGYCISLSHDQKNNYLVLYSADSDCLTLGSLPIQVDQTKSDEQLLSDLSAIQQLLLEIFAESFSDIKIVRNYNSWENGVANLNVYFYDADAHPLNKFLETPVSDHISLHFSRNRNIASPLMEPILTNVTIRYYQFREKAENTNAVIAQAKRISLAEAEILLEKGYVFGGHACQLCMQQQENVDFSQYQYVSFTYLWGRDENGNRTYCIPFYAFYKSIGTADNGNEIYARTYVPAIEISGLDEYFENQIANHN